MFEFDVQKPSLDRVQSAVIAFDVVIVLLGLAVIAKHTHAGRDGGIVRGGCTSFPACPKILAWVKAESGRVAHRPGLLPAVLPSRKVLRTVCLAGILDNKNAILVRQLKNSVHVSHLAIEMHGD